MPRLIYNSVAKVEWNDRRARFFMRWPRAGGKFTPWTLDKTVPMTPEVARQIESLRPADAFEAHFDKAVALGLAVYTSKDGSVVLEQARHSIGGVAATFWYVKCAGRVLDGGNASDSKQLAMQALAAKRVFGA